MYFKIVTVALHVPVDEPLGMFHSAPDRGQCMLHSLFSLGGQQNQIHVEPTPELWRNPALQVTAHHLAQEPVTCRPLRWG